MNVCGACGLDFGGIAAFDAHRVGRHEYTLAQGLQMDPPREDGRRCLDLDELLGLGFVQNAYGRWTTPENVSRGLTWNPRSAERAA
jgi:hypothetical protein